MPTVTAVNVTLPSLTTKTPSSSVGSPLATLAVAVVVESAVESSGCSRTVNAMMGTESASSRISVTISAVADRSGRSWAPVGSRVMTTSKSMAACCPAVCRDVGLVHLDHDLDDRKVGDGQDQASRVVHGPDDDRLALLHVEAGDLAID